MAQQDRPRPTLTVEIRDPLTLADVKKWADLANVLDFPSESPVAVEGMSFRGLRVTAWLDDIEPPTEDEATP